MTATDDRRPLPLPTAPRAGRAARPPRVRVGCAGWSIPSQHGALFGPGDSQLARYATAFDAVEINSSFHRPHRRETYERWAAAVPAGFRFSVKLPRTITHDLRLRGAGPTLDAFAGQVAGLGRRLGCVLVQLPPSLAFEARVAATFFAMLQRRLDVPVACEPRHASWFEPAVDAIWHRHGIARVAADPARLPEAAEPGGDPSWQYWRWHGSPRIYYSRYDDDTLRALALRLRRVPRARASWCVFDNTAGGHAVDDAARLDALLGGA